MPLPTRSAPIPYYGGKFHLSKLLVSLMPVHSVYVECFGGGASFLFAKPKSEIEVYNDIDKTLFTLFKVLRDPHKFWEFYWSLCLTPFSRDEYKLSLQTGDDEQLQDVELARRAYFDIRASIQARRGSGLSFPVSPGSLNSPEVTQNAVAELPLIRERLRDVVVENKDAISLMNQYSHPNTLIYLDPPYTHGERNARAKYRFEVDDDYHHKLLDAALAHPGMVMLSGYENPLYAALDKAGWDKRHANTFTVAAGRHSDPNLTHKRTEVIWRNPACLAHHMQRLFEIEQVVEIETVTVPAAEIQPEEQERAIDAVMDILGWGGEIPEWENASTLT